MFLLPNIHLLAVRYMYYSTVESTLITILIYKLISATLFSLHCYQTDSPNHDYNGIVARDFTPPHDVTPPPEEDGYSLFIPRVVVSEEAKKERIALRRNMKGLDEFTRKLSVDGNRWKSKPE